MLIHNLNINGEPGNEQTFTRLLYDEILELKTSRAYENNYC